MEKRKCLICDEEIYGRKDKIFCSTNCKSADQYEKIREKDLLFFRVDAQLKINRKVLKKHNRNGKTVLRREALHSEGFDPNFFTHFRKTSKGDVYFYCYDFGFLKLKEIAGKEVKLKYLIVNWNGK